MKHKGKKGLAHPARIITTKGKRKRSDKGRPLFYYDDMAVELIVNAVEQISSLIRGCRKEGVVGARASTARLEVGVRKQGLRLKKVVSSG
jgi:hypothetical protein